MDRPPPDRRHTSRLCAAQTRRVLSSRLRTGPDIVLVDFCTGGALIESDRRLLPGSRVQLQVLTTGGRFMLTGRLVRAEVAAVTTDRVRYRGAIEFDGASTSAAASLGRSLQGTVYPSIGGTPASGNAAGAHWPPLSAGERDGTPFGSPESAPRTPERRKPS